MMSMGKEGDTGRRLRKSSCSVISYVGLRFLPHWRLVQQVVVEGQHLGPEEVQDISRAVIAAREKPRRLFPQTQGFLRCSCKENEMVDKK